MQQDNTHFGYKEVPTSEKEGLVAGVFSSVAASYDVMNDLMSLGVHRLWKRRAINKLAVRPGMRSLDVAAGTGDLTKLLYDKFGSDIEQVMTDINLDMLSAGRDRFMDAGINSVPFLQADAQSLPFADNSFDRVTIGFGLRNVTDKDQALRDMFRVLRPGGMLLVLEFSKPVIPALAKIYDKYSFTCLPWLGEVVAKDRDSYQYLAESIRKHPDQKTLQNMFSAAGFEDAAYENMTGGVVAMHWGYKY
jgi:demethylmenaquinone methyltransferase / 2-methoxy-6-polyprenyl-1,4-benzoquinol methylase